MAGFTVLFQDPIRSYPRLPPALKSMRLKARFLIPNYK